MQLWILWLVLLLLPKESSMPTRTSNPAVPGVKASRTFLYACAAAAAAAGWKYHRALRSLGQTPNSSSGEGLAFICRWVELLGPREKRATGSLHVCGEKEGGKQGPCEKETTYCIDMFAAFEVIINRSKLARGEKTGNPISCTTVYHREEDSCLTWTSRCILCMQKDLRAWSHFGWPRWLRSRIELRGGGVVTATAHIQSLISISPRRPLPMLFRLFTFLFPKDL